MDGLAVASVVTSGLLGLAAIGAALWSTRVNVRLTREGRVLERRADAYLELLRIIEREGLWLETRAVRLATPYDPYGPDRPKVAPQPVITDRATVAALLAAFASPRLRRECEEWRRRGDAFENQHEALVWNWQESGGGDPSAEPEPDDVKALLACLEDERVVRIAIAETVAYEIAEGKPRR